MNKGKVTGVGGVFLTSEDPDATKKWYQKHLGIEMDDYGHMFTSAEKSESSAHMLQWSVMKKGDDYLKPTSEPFMINYRVDDLELLLEKLQKLNVEICDEIASYSYGKFLHIIDCDGRKVELWEPVESGF